MPHEMATKQASVSDVDEEEDCIDIKLSPFSNFYYHSIGSPSPPQNREVESQKEKKSTTSQADMLFNKGKFLPLHNPPRLQMVQKHLYNTNATFYLSRSQSKLEQISIPFTTTDLKLPSTNATTPLESRNITPSQSHRFSSYEPNQSEFLFEWFTGRYGFVVDAPKKSWSQKLKEIKQFWLSQKLKTSKDYLKSLFTKSGCSDNKSCANSANKVGEVIKPKFKDSQINNVNDPRAKKKPFEISYDNNKHRKSCSVMNNVNRNIVEDGFRNRSRKSFLGVFQRHWSSKASSLSTSSSGSTSKSSSFSHSSGMSKRSIGANAELENSIEAAIAHCKQSLKQCGSNKTPDSQLASKTAVCGDQEKAAIGMAEPKGE